MTRTQNLSLMDGTSRAFFNYLDQLQKFHTQQGHSLSYIPILDRKPINLLRLKKSVDELGGHKNVTEKKQWAAVGRAIGLGGKTCTSLSHSIKRIFTRWILPYEEYMIHNNINSKSRRISRIAQDPEGSAKTEDIGDPDALGNVLYPDADRISPKVHQRSAQRKRLITSQNPELSEKSPIKARRLKSEDPNSTRSATESRSPDTSILGDKNSKKYDKAQPGEEICEFCGSGANDEKMLLCDGCDRGYHLYCFDPPIAEIPPTDWYCPHCLEIPKGSYGFEEKEVRSLHKFQKIASRFKNDYFREKFGNEPGDRLEVTENDCEAEFWETVQSSYGDLTIEYGADLHSSRHGSGFPTIEKQPYNEYSRCGWNLNVLPLIEGSILNYTKKKGISGIMTPWLYVGMLFSTFCWHAEDQHLYSMSYSHWGETKTWYGIPSESTDDMEKVMRKEFPDLFKTSPDLLFHITTLLSPKILMENGVTCYVADQRPGEFIITFPGAYHCGFSHGFNFTEAVNFAFFDWLPYGHKCLDLLSSYKRAPLFPYEEIVLCASKALVSCEIKLDDDDFALLLGAFTELYNKELCLRKIAREKIISSETLLHHDEDDPAYAECHLCSKFCYISSITFPTNDESSKNGDKDSAQDQKRIHYCLNHYQTPDSLPHVKKLVLNCYFSDDELSSLLSDLENYTKPCPPD